MVAEDSRAASPRSLRPHDHAGRTAVVEEVIQRLEARFGEHLVAIVATGSYARGDDRGYSDLELVAFLDDETAAGGRHGVGVFLDGMLVECQFTTRTAYLKAFEYPNADWCLVASDPLTPITNPEFVDAVRAEAATFVERAGQPDDPVATRLLAVAAGHQLTEVQESISKMMNELADPRYPTSVALLAWDAVRHYLVMLSLLNARPYTTFAAFLVEAHKLPVRPEGTDELLALAEEGRLSDAAALGRLLPRVLAGVEDELLRRGADPFERGLDAV